MNRQVFNTIAGIVGGGIPYQSRVIALAPYAYWPLNDLGTVEAKELMGNVDNNIDIIFNGGFETLGAGGADVFANWTETADAGTIEVESTIIHEGTKAVKLTSGATFNTRIQQVINVFPGEEISLKFWTRGDGTNAGRYAIYNVQGAAWIKSLSTTGVTATEYTEVITNFTTAANCYQITVYLYAPNVNGGYTYFDATTCVVNSRKMSGRLSPTGITYNEPGIGDGNTSLKFSGTSTFVDIGTKGAFNKFWNGNKGSAIAWGKVDTAARWDDLTAQRYLFHPKSATDETVYIAFGKSLDANNTLTWLRRITNAAFKAQYVFTSPPTDWFCMGMIWDLESNPKRIACYLYANGVFTKVYDDTPIQGNELWDKETYPVNNGNNVLYAGSNTNSQTWIGWGANCSVFDKVLTDSEMKKLMKP